MASKLSMIHAEVKKIQKGKYEDSRKEEIQAEVSGDKSVIFQRQHAQLMEGYKREKHRLDRMLSRKKRASPSNPSVPRPERVDAKVDHVPPNQNPLTENWHLYALKYSNEYRLRHSQQLLQSSSSHLTHSNSLPPRAAPRQYFHSLSMNETSSHRGLGTGAGGAGGAANWQPRSIGVEPDLSDTMLSEVYCAVGYSYASN